MPPLQKSSSPSTPAPQKGFSTYIPDAPTPQKSFSTSAPAPQKGFTTHVPQLRNTFPIPPDVPEPMPSLTIGPRVKSIFIIVLVLVAFGVYRQWRGNSSALASWQSSWEKGVDESHAQKKPILVLFTADWCAACNHFKENVLSRADVTRQLEEQFVLVKQDLTDRSGPGSKVAQEFGVRVIPTLVIVGPDGSRSDYLTGSVSQEYLEEWTASRKAPKRR